MAGESKRVETMNYFELLAWLGIGSSHPGGFPATKENLEILSIDSAAYVLDAGCGSGLTACYLAKTSGCRIIGIDINPQMIEKASLRAQKEGVAHLVTFQIADAANLPFEDNLFDWVIGESITVFLDKVKVYREFYRVLKPKGKAADLEMALLSDLPDALRKQMKECFGYETDPLSYEKWAATLEEAGFCNVEIKNTQPLKDNRQVITNELKKDWILIKDLAGKVSSQPALLPRLQKNASFTKKYRSYFGYGLIFGEKPDVQPTKPSFRTWLARIRFWRNIFPFK